MTYFAKTAEEMKTVEFVNMLNNEGNNFDFDEKNKNDGYPILLSVMDIEIQKEPNKLYYRKNIDNLDLSGGKIKLKYNYSEYDTILDMNNTMFSVSGFSNTEEGNINLKVSYTDKNEYIFEKEFEIKIVDDSIPPECLVSYSTTEMTNQNVTAIVTSNEEIQAVNGWTLSTDKKSMTKVYSSNRQEEVIIKDLVGNETKVNVRVANIDKEAPVGQISYSTTKMTNQNVTATITSNEEIQAVGGWTLSTDKKSMEKEYSRNVQEEVIIKDLVGNETKININVANIDKEAPVGQVSYSTTEMTNKDVIVTITANEKIQQVEGWSLSSDLTKLTKTFTKNDEETVIIKDLAGNTSSVDVNINNIDKTEVEAVVKYSTTLLTNQNVDVDIELNKKVKPISGWASSEDGKVLSKTFEKNREEKLTIYDYFGNSKNVTINVTNIDKEVSIEKVDYSTTEMTNKDVTVTIIANEKIQQVEGWTLSSDLTKLTKTFSENDEETLEIVDFAENFVELNIEVNNIDKVSPEVDVQYNTEEKAESVTVTINANEEIQEVNGWTLNADKKSMTKEYLRNSKEEVRIYDLAGNSTTQEIIINNIIDKAKEENEDRNIVSKKINKNNGQDETLATKILPKTGLKTVIIAFIIVLILEIIFYRVKLKKLKDIK